MIILGGVPLLIIVLVFFLILFCLAPTIIQYCLIALLTAAGATYLRKLSRRVLFVVPGVGLVLSSCLGIAAWNDRNQLSKYGVSYDITCGEHAEFQTVWFHWDRNGKRIDGPMIQGDELYVKFRYVEHDNVPQIVVRSKTYKERSVILKLNFTDASKPGFELVGDPGMHTEYCAPWIDFYRETEKDK